MKEFVKKYLSVYANKPLKILDIGSMDVNGTYKPLFNVSGWSYFGCDLEKGKNVDIVLAGMYDWKNIESESFDVVISGQCFEHVEYFWITMLEITRVLKENGICCIIAPSSGPEHRFPVDCWRFYPDGFRSLAKYCGLQVIELSTDWHGSAPWHDSWMVCSKPSLTDEQKELFNYKNYLSKLIVDDSTLKSFIKKINT
ncbi:methyltransferase domain-containing protein [Ammoniphilus sp. 3BR4]|uniref:methyltransferase domain-containing protein n=1 Tax=Ammoniphilus sp. 3BR4 TaxID=3158265 RepID=UPI003465D458